MKVFAFLSLLMTATPVSSLHLCEPFSQAKHEDLTLSILEAEKTQNGVSFTFFVEKEGVDSFNEYAVADMGPLYKKVKKLPLKAHASTGSKLVDCRISTPGWENWRFYARADCPVDGDDPHVLSLYIKDSAINLELCSDPEPPSRPDVSLAACVRSFSSTVFGTDQVAVTPSHVIRWLDYHIKLGIERFYLYERNKGELSEFLEPYMKKNPSVRGMVEIAYVPLLSEQKNTFDVLETKSYIYDQILVMNACFSRARTEKYDYVFHIDYDEYIHLGKEASSVHQAVTEDMAQCSTPNGLTMVRCNIAGVKFDVPDTPPDAVCTNNDRNLKTAFNATFMGGDVFFNVHFIDPRCYSKSVYIHHLPDAYAERSNKPTFLENLTEKK